MIAATDIPSVTKSSSSSGLGGRLPLPVSIVVVVVPLAKVDKHTKQTAANMVTMAAEVVSP